MHKGEKLAWETRCSSSPTTSGSTRRCEAKYGAVKRPRPKTIASRTPNGKGVQLVKQRNENDEWSTGRVAPEHRPPGPDPLDDSAARDPEQGHRNDLDCEDDAHGASETRS